MPQIFQQLRQILKVTIWAFQFQYKALGGWFLFQFVRTTYDNMQNLLYSFFLGQLINTLVNANFDVDMNVLQPIISIGIVWLVRQLLHFDDYLFDFYRNETNRKAFTQSILERITLLDWQKIEEPETEKMLRTNLDNGNWPLQSYIESISYLFTILIGLIFVASTVELSWMLIAALLIGTVPTGIQTLWYTYVDARIFDSLLPKYVKLSGIVDFFHNSGTMFESKITKAEQYLRQVEARERDSNISLYYAQFSKLFWTNFVTLTTSVGANVWVLWYLVQQVVQFGLPIGTFQYSLTAFHKLNGDTISLFNSLGRIEDCYRYLIQFYKLLHLKPSLEDGVKLITNNDPMDISFTNVSFRYPGSTETSLDNITVQIREGEKVALVGENGAGKSSFIKLLLRAYDPSSGSIEVGKTDLKEIQKSSWYDQLTMIPQDFARYDVLTVGENISLELSGGNEKLQQAAELSNAHEFIQKLPHKYQTLLTKKLEGGTELSSGQWQRLALARLFHLEKRLVILDEPTASIDPVAEYNIFRNVYKKLSGKTVILVSHRYNTVKDADRILVFKDGKIIEQGSFQELLQADGYFAKAYKLQDEAKQFSGKHKTHPSLV